MFFRGSANLPPNGSAARRRQGVKLSASWILYAVVAVFFAGCVYKGAKITEGTDFSAGVSLPGTDGAAEVSFVNLLTGFRFGVDRGCGLECEFRGTNAFSFAWGLYESRSTKCFTATVTPYETTVTNVPVANQ